jgi:hypothetical protein
MLRQMFSFSTDRASKRRRLLALEDTSQEGASESRCLTYNHEGVNSRNQEDYTESIYEGSSNVYSTAQNTEGKTKVVADVSKLDFIPKIIVTELSHFDKIIVLEAMAKLNEHIGSIDDEKNYSDIIVKGNDGEYQSEEKGSEGNDEIDGYGVGDKNVEQIDSWREVDELVVRDEENKGALKLNYRNADSCDVYFSEWAETTNHQKETFYEAGGHTAIIVVMNRWHTCPVIQKNGCLLLAKVSAGSNPIFLSASMKVGALETILTAMINFPKDVGVQREAAYALRFITSDQSSSIRLVTELEGLGPIVQAMTTYPEDAPLQMASVSIMFSLSAYENLVPHIIAAGGLVALATAIQILHNYQFRTSDEIEQCARATLKRLLALQNFNA